MAKFLIIRFSSIGDIVLTTPVVRCLKQQVKESEIHYLTKKNFTPIIAENPYIDRIHILEESLWKVIGELKKEKFDYIIDLHRNIRTFLVKLSLNTITFSFNKLNLKKWLLVNIKRDRLPRKHIVDRYLETLKLFSISNDGNGLDYFLPDSAHFDMDEVVNTHSKKIVTIVAGGGHFTKQIPGEKLTELIQALDFNIMLIGGKEDIPKAELILSQLGMKKVNNLVGKLSLAESALLIKQSDIIVTPDTGMMHIAAAFKKPVISLWGNTVPEFGMYPYLPGKGSAIFEIKGLSCRPCSKIGFSKCPKNHFRCMQEQNIKEITLTINKILSLNE